MALHNDTDPANGDGISPVARSVWNEYWTTHDRSPSVRELEEGANLSHRQAYKQWQLLTAELDQPAPEVVADAEAPPPADPDADDLLPAAPSLEDADHDLGYTRPALPDPQQVDAAVQAAAAQLATAQAQAARWQAQLGELRLARDTKTADILALRKRHDAEEPVLDLLNTARTERLLRRTSRILRRCCGSTRHSSRRPT